MSVRHALDEQNAGQWLRDRGWIGAAETVRVSRLTGGVSNDVFRVERESGNGDDFVLKQARGQLRVEERWTCSIERIWRERDVLLAIESLLRDESQVATPKLSTPKLLHEDAAAYVIAISAAPPDNTTWKERLLQGEVQPDAAAACGRMLGAIHANAWGGGPLCEPFEDLAFFDALRIDPYYRHVARQRPELAAAYEALENSLLENRCTLVHGDFSPKNLLVSPGAMMLLDFEVGHYGDAAFDLGFFLTHLTLKYALARFIGQAWSRDLSSLIHVFTNEYERRLSQRVEADDRTRLWSRTRQTWVACCLARIDGKSPVEYLQAPMIDPLRATFSAMLIESIDSCESLAALSADVLTRIDAAIPQQT